MHSVARAAALAALLSSGAIFGFFFAYASSVMAGLDNAPASIAIPAMQQINAAVRNPAFALGFFGTPLFLGLAAVACHIAAARRAVAFFVAATILFLIGTLGLTTIFNVPMNQALAEITQTASGSAQDIWQGHSPRWQGFNTARTISLGAVLFLAALGVSALEKSAERRSRGKSAPT